MKVYRPLTPYTHYMYTQSLVIFSVIVWENTFKLSKPISLVWLVPSLLSLAAHVWTRWVWIKSIIHFCSECWPVLSSQILGSPPQWYQLSPHPSEELDTLLNALTSGEMTGCHGNSNDRDMMLMCNTVHSLLDELPTTNSLQGEQLSSKI